MTMLAPGATIGILGGGQLGRMLAIACAELGYHTHIYCPEKDCPASEVARHFTCAPYEDEQALTAFAKMVDVATFEFENIPSFPLAAVTAHTSMHPSLEVLRICQHRIFEKEFLRSLGIGTAPFAPVRSAEELQKAITTIGTPTILKTTQLGYDGKGQAKILTPEEAEAAWNALGATEAILEGFVDFEREISVIVARSSTGETACFPPVENIHKNHILHQTIAPAALREALTQEAERMACAIAEGLKLIGILAVEMFVTKDGALLVNELAPRPHNSGHWTLDACITSQFEQTVRAICGLPLGSTQPLCNAVMTNLIGDDINEWQRWLCESNARLHLYGKKEARPGRKMGHVTHLACPSNPKGFSG